jgi:uncharacterized protein
LIVVLDASTLVGAALKPDSVPEQALLRIVRDYQLIVSDEVAAEYRAVLERPKFARSLPLERRERIPRIGRPCRYLRGGSRGG